jgi:virulence factor Mce-like protein
VRRVATALVGALLLGGGLLLLLRDDGDGNYRVAAIFDTARGLVPGQQVKIAGAVVGEIDSVHVVPGPRARIVMDVERRFAPFRSDARCRILPEGLISENFVDCNPGSASAAPLAAATGAVPTLPISRTAVPTSLQDFFNVFSASTGDRLRVLFNELGIATAGRGQDLNALLRRANPALAQTQRALAILDGQRRRIARAVGQTDRVLASLAQRDRDVRAFVGNTAAVTKATASVSEPLGATIHDLPPLLRQTRAGLGSLDRAIADGTPLLRDLRTAAPGVIEFTHTLPDFMTAGTPALRSLAKAARAGRPAVRDARLVGKRLRTTAASSVPFGRDLRGLLTSTRDQGGFEGLLRVAYSLATSMAAYDELSHMVGLGVTVLPQCVLSAATAGCPAGYDAPGHGTIPPNAASCGPQPKATWDKATNCQPLPPAKSSAAELEPALDYLLGP